LKGYRRYEFKNEEDEEIIGDFNRKCENLAESSREVPFKNQAMFLVTEYMWITQLRDWFSKAWLIHHHHWGLAAHRLASELIWNLQNTLGLRYLR